MSVDFYFSFWLCILFSRYLRPMTSQREETMKCLYGPVSRFVSWSPTIREGTLNGAWWRREVGREAMCPPTTLPSPLWGRGPPAPTSPTARRDRCPVSTCTVWQRFHQIIWRITAVFLQWSCTCFSNCSMNLYGNYIKLTLEPLNNLQLFTGHCVSIRKGQNLQI